MLVGDHYRAVHDNYPLAVDFSRCGVFATTPVSSATVASDDPTLTLGTPDVTTTSNVAAFRVSGGAIGRAGVTVTATNGTQTVCRTVAVHTEDC